MWHIYILVFDLHCYVSAADEIHLHLICFANVNTSSGRFGICPQPDTDEWVEFKNSQVWYWDVSLHGCDTVISHSYALWKFKIVFKFSMCCINVYHWLTIQQNLFVGKFSEPRYYSSFLVQGDISVTLQIFTLGRRTCHVRDVALLLFRQEIDASRTNLIE